MKIFSQLLCILSIVCVLSLSACEDASDILPKSKLSIKKMQKQLEVGHCYTTYKLSVWDVYVCKESDNSIVEKKSEQLTPEQQKECNRAVVEGVANGTDKGK